MLLRILAVPEYPEMSLESFLSEFRRKTQLVRDPRFAMSFRLALNGQVEIRFRTVGGELVLDWIGTREGGKGLGSAALTWVCEMADKHKVALTANVVGDRTFVGYLRFLANLEGGRSQPSLTPAQLRSWYRRYGFVTYRRIASKDDYEKSDNFDVLMLRKPKRARRARRA